MNCSNCEPLALNEKIHKLVDFLAILPALIRMV